MSTRLAAKKEDEKVLTQLVREAKKDRTINFNQNLFFYLVALVSTILPSYLFQGVLNLEFTGGTILLFLIVSCVSAYFLSKAYVFNYLRKKPILTDNYEKIVTNAKGSFNKKDKEEAYAKKDKLAELGATGHALFISNIIFFALVLFFSFYSLKRIDVRINYVASLLLSSFGVNYISKPRSA
ncbi:predicted protein [Naegleria gruberi]|uniref:Predicted protein n=1 Tax=Naegleria gruberi TaxID=5762 RepID=D2VZZ9_NAEGR|nr:uncharacterized protein NAEGRDRAFT_74677 [Naegleria gruberi]EFC37657.1 predicted protein [Naegleria gruberi]|eukprot:XP_002670401.1 predicted protein [Naegleria gruberi strain NEG-M]